MRESSSSGAYTENTMCVPLRNWIALCTQLGCNYFKIRRRPAMIISHRQTKGGGGGGGGRGCWLAPTHRGTFFRHCFLFVVPFRSWWRQWRRLLAASKPPPRNFVTYFYGLDKVSFIGPDFVMSISISVAISAVECRYLYSVCPYCTIYICFPCQFLRAIESTEGEIISFADNVTKTVIVKISCKFWYIYI